MVKQALRSAASGLMVLGFILYLLQPLAAQTVTALPKVDLNQFVGAWYEIARFPDKVEKPCISDGMVLYAAGDKPRRFQMVTSCLLKGATPEAWNANGTIDKAGDGRLKITYIWPFSHKYWVLATGPAYEWLLIGAPNHKSLWILSRDKSITPELFDEIKQKATAQGFNLNKLITISQTH